MTKLLSSAVFAIAVVGFAPLCSAAIMSYDAILTGASESPPNASPGTGDAQVDYNNTAHTLHVHIDFNGLLGTTTASHIHSATAVPGAGNAGVATTTPSFAGFPLGVTAGTYDNTLDETMASSWNPSFITAHGGTTAGAESFFAASLAAGTAYLNIHTNFSPGGEIRGFLEPVPVPEPATSALAAIGTLSLLLARRAVRRS